MKNEMTERDRKLLVFLAIFVVVACTGYWGIRPLVNSIKNTNEEIADVSSEIEISEAKSAMLPLLFEEHDLLTAEVYEAKKDFYREMSSDEIDKYITGMILDYGLYCYDLSISISEDDANLSKYIYTKESEEFYDEEYYDEEYYAYDTEDVTNGIREVRVALRVGGNEETLQKLIDDLSKSDKELLVLSYDWNNYYDTNYLEDGSYEVVEAKELNLVLNFYMAIEQSELE